MERRIERSRWLQPTQAAEDVLPDQHAAAVHPGRVQFAGVIAVPARIWCCMCRRSNHLFRSTPGTCAVVEPLGPGQVMVVQIRSSGSAALDFQDDARAHGVELGAKLRMPLRAACPGRCRRPRWPPTNSASISTSDLAFAARPGVPGVVVDEDPDAACDAGADSASRRPGKAAGHVAVEVELVAVIEADPRIRVPEHDAS